MTDLHTHILPKMDDGSKSVEMSVAMLVRQWQQGVKTVALTPHYYRDMEHTPDFLHRRAEAYELLKRGIAAATPLDRHRMPRLLLGAEVTWVSGIAEWRHLHDLCYEGTNYLLLEPPFHSWEEGFLNDLYDLVSRRDVVPVIAHIDRYFSNQKPELLNSLFSLGLPTQISAEAFLSMRTRGRALRTIEKGGAQLLISDCHDLTHRPPNLGEAMKVVQKKLGGRASAFFRETDGLLASGDGNTVK